MKAFAAADLAPHIHKKKTAFPGIDPDTLEKLQARAKLRADGGRPYAKQPLAFPGHARELFFDVETHPMLDLCYLHGFVVRENRDDATERCVQFFADEPTPPLTPRTPTGPPGCFAFALLAGSRPEPLTSVH